MMVFVYYHKETVEVENGRITSEAYGKLEERLRKLGWSELK